MCARRCGRYGDPQRACGLGHRKAFKIVNDDDGAAMGRKLSDPRVLALVERRNQARRLPSAVYRRFSEGFGTADLVAAKALLDTLRS